MDVNIDWVTWAPLILAGAAVILVVALLRGERSRTESSMHMARISDTAQRLTETQAQLAGRVEQTQVALSARLDGLTRRLGESLTQQSEKTGDSLRVLHERLAVIDAAQKNITELSAQMVGLQDILSNKQARGAFGEVQLRDLVTAVLPSSAFVFQAPLGNGRRVDCLLKLPDPPGPIALDAKFPLESYRALRDAGTEAAKVQAARAFGADVLTHVKDIHERYIVPGETANSAMMFLPSEAVYAELHANFRNVIEESFRRKVWIVSPTTLWATLNTLRAVLKDVRMREQAGLIQTELRAMTGDVIRLDDRVQKLQRHFEQSVDDMRQIRLSSEKVARRAERIEEFQMGEDTAQPVSAPEPLPQPFEPSRD